MTHQYICYSFVRLDPPLPGYLCLYGCVLFRLSGDKHVAREERIERTIDGIFDALTENQDKSNGKYTDKQCGERCGSTQALSSHVAICEHNRCFPGTRGKHDDGIDSCCEREYE